MITFNLSTTDFQINNASVKFPLVIDDLRKIFVVADRVNKKKHNTIYTWDELGILAYSKDGELVEGICLVLQPDTFDFSPKETFSGIFHFDQEEIMAYYTSNKDKRVALFDGDTSGALVLNDMSVWFELDANEIKAIEISAYKKTSEEEGIPKDKYVIKKLDEEEIIFADFGFKLSIIQELMYNKELLVPKFDLFEFVKWYPHRKIDLEEEEGYNPISEITQYFKDLPIPKRLAAEVTEIYQDGGNDIYMNLIRFGEGWETYWDIEHIDDAKQFPNLKTATLCYAKDHVLEELNAIGIKTEWV
jgi:hypothetical protein